MSIRGDVKSLTKVGQDPPQSVLPPKSLAALLKKDDLQLLKNGLLCHHHSLGIASAAYLRRVVENNVNTLLEVAIASIPVEEQDEEFKRRVTEIRNEKRFGNKLEAIKALLPNDLIVDGQNPIALLHDLASESLHRMSDDESIDVFDRGLTALDFIVEMMHHKQKKREEYRKAVAALMSKKQG